MYFHPKHHLAENSSQICKDLFGTLYLFVIHFIDSEIKNQVLKVSLSYLKEPVQRVRTIPENL